MIIRIFDKNINKLQRSADKNPIVWRCVIFILEAIAFVGKVYLSLLTIKIIAIVFKNIVSVR
ncbi:MAG: hypothetical protein JG777_3179 [Clostridia bacterium]|jgi:hypothetical protein|nr:hypothetical protein [Clostridia bacterium]